MIPRYDPKKIPRRYERRETRLFFFEYTLLIPRMQTQQTYSNFKFLVLDIFLIWQIQNSRLILLQCGRLVRRMVRDEVRVLTVTIVKYGDNRQHNMLARLNYLITICTLLNLGFVTLSVWFFPKVWIFQITSTIAWLLIALQYIVAHKIHRVGLVK